MRTSQQKAPEEEKSARGGAAASLEQTKIYVSLTLERPMQSYVDSLCAVALNWATFTPLPMTCKKFSVVMTTDGF